jgi:hypothetical protein
LRWGIFFLCKEIQISVKQYQISDRINRSIEIEVNVAYKAYIGDNAITTPYKKPKKSEISQVQKEQNKELSSRRIGVEHMICRVKIFRVASEKFRLSRHRYNQVIMAVCGLVRLRLNCSWFLSVNN